MKSEKLFDELFSELMEIQKTEVKTAERYNAQLDRITRIRELSEKDGMLFPLLDEIEERIKKIIWDKSTAIIGIVPIDALNYPAGYQVGKFIFQNTQDSITFTLNGECRFCAGGVTGSGTGEQTVALSPDDFVHNEEDDNYFVYLVTDKAIGISSSVPYEVV